MNRAANPHWIGPRRGTYVSVVLDTDCSLVVGNAGYDPCIFRAVIVDPYRARIRDDVLKPFTVMLDAAGEGTKWCLDWSGDNVDALTALIKLSSST